MLQLRSGCRCPEKAHDACAAPSVDAWVVAQAAGTWNEEEKEAEVRDEGMGEAQPPAVLRGLPVNEEGLGLPLKLPVPALAPPGQRLKERAARRREDAVV
jgi:hypothetical protein